MAQTTSSSYWSGLRDSLTSLFIDSARAKLIDVETTNTAKNIPDQADLAAGQTGAPIATAPGGLPIAAWVIIGVGVFFGAQLLKKGL